MCSLIGGCDANIFQGQKFMPFQTWYHCEPDNVIDQNEDIFIDSIECKNKGTEAITPHDKNNNLTWYQLRWNWSETTTSLLT